MACLLQFRLLVLLVSLIYIAPSFVLSGIAGAQTSSQDAPLPAPRRVEEPAQVSEQQLIEAIRKLQKEGKFEAASRQAGELARRNPNNPVAQALQRQAAIAAAQAAGRDLQSDADRRRFSASRGVMQSALPPSGDLQFPADWKSRARDRTSSVTLAMTAKESSIMQALSTPLSISFTDSALDSVIEYLRTRAGVPIVMDKSALDAAGVTYQSKVSVRLPDVSLRTILRRVLGDLGLTYVVKDEAIQVITPQQAREMTVTRVYPIRDLVTGDWWDVNFGLDEFVAARNAAMLIDLIRHTVDPPSWDVNGGPGSISYDASRRALVVKQTAEFHGVLGTSR